MSNSAVAMAPHIRWMIRRDMNEVMEIERASFEFPYSESDVIRLLLQRNFIGMVADCDGVVAGFMIYALYGDEIHLHDIAVHPDCRGLGLFRAMLNQLGSKLSTARRRRILTDVRETNIGAQKAFAACGYTCVGTVPAPYEEVDEDGLRFICEPSALEHVVGRRFAPLAFRLTPRLEDDGIHGDAMGAC